MDSTRRLQVLMAGLGAAAALTLAPLATEVAQAAQPPVAPPETTTTTIATSGTWTSSAGTGTLVECPYSTYARIPGADWIWASLGQVACRGPGEGPGTVSGGSATFSTTFDVPGNPQGASLTLVADNGATVSVNGVQVADLAANTTGTAITQVHTYTFTNGLQPGTNTISITGTNLPTAGYNPAGG